MTAAFRMALMILGAGFGGVAGAADMPPTRLIMDGIFGPMTEALALSFAGDAFQAPANRARVRTQLEALSANVATLEQHARSQDPGFDFVARSLGTDARRLARDYAAGRFNAARFTLHNMTDNCIACHSSLPSGGVVPDAKAFLARIDAEKLQPIERAQLQVVTRQFDAALGSYEALFRDENADVEQLVTMGSMADYLKLSIAVKSDLKRPQAVLGLMKSRPGTALHVRRQLDRWIADLVSLAKSRALDAANPLDQARALLNDARPLMDYPQDRDVLVRFVTADALLARYLKAHASDTGPTAGEAYYMRGTAESLLEHSYWLSRADFYFEMAIRLAPGAAFAPKAFERLAENLSERDDSLAGTRLAPEAEMLLGELRRLIGQANAGRL